MARVGDPQIGDLLDQIRRLELIIARLGIVVPDWYSMALIENEQDETVPESIKTELAAVAKSVNDSQEKLRRISIGAVCPDCGSDKWSNNSGGYFQCPTRGKMIGSPHERNGKSWSSDEYKRMVTSDLKADMEHNNKLKDAWA